MYEKTTGRQTENAFHFALKEQKKIAVIGVNLNMTFNMST